MSLKLDQHIYNMLLEHHKGDRKKIVSTNQTTLSQMSKGKSNLKISTVRQLLKDNGMTGEITIYGAGTKTTVNLFS